MATNLVFVRGGDGEGVDRVYVTRDDGSEVSFPIWPSAVGGLPHDLVHLVVEAQLGLSLGFWGLMAAGGRPKAPVGERDPSQLLQAEAVVNVLTGHGSQGHTNDADRAAAVAVACGAAGVAEPPGLDETAIARVLAAISEEAAAWKAVPLGAALRRTWPDPSS